MTNNSLNNNRLARNTILLYGRMLLILLVSLYTSRVVLAALGIEDYGLYNVVGGVVTMFAFINYAMANSSNRYIAYALGKENEKELKDVVDGTCLIHLIIAGIILVLAETIGLWFFYNKLVIPEDRLVAAVWVFHFSVIACILSIFCVPFNALIIAHEKMGAFAIITIIDAFLKLIVALVIQYTSKDRLVLYAALILGIGVLDFILYWSYCRRFFKEAKHIRLKWVPQLKEMSSFAGWSLFGNLAFIGYTQGLNIILNMFFGPAVNAARGVAVQVESALKGFVTSFQTAVNPQIVKTYAQGDLNHLHTLIYSGSKLSYYLLYCMVLPICIEADTILSVWLKDVPQYAAIFTILVLIISLSEPLRNPIDRANQAVGNIRNYQIVEGSLLMLIVPIAYLILKLGGEPYSVFIVQLVVMYLVQVVRLFLVCHKIRMSKLEYVKRVFIPIFIVSFLSALLPILLHITLPQTLYSSFIVIIVSVLSVIVLAYCVGLNTNEKAFVKLKIEDLYHKVIPIKDSK